MYHTGGGREAVARTKPSTLCGSESNGDGAVSIRDWQKGSAVSGSAWEIVIRFGTSKFSREAFVEACSSG